MAALCLIFLDQICPKWIKLHQIEFPHQSKNVTKKVVTFTERIKMAVFISIFLDKICPNLIKLNQIGFPHQSKNVTIKSCHIYRKNKNGCFVLDFFGSDLSKLDQT